MEKKKALVTGGNGFLGSAITRSLLDTGWEVRILARGQTGIPEKKEHLSWIRADIRDRGQVMQAAEGVETVFHTAALAGVWGPEENYRSINVEGTENILEACKAAGCRLIHSSSPSVIFDGSDMEGVDTSHPYPDTYSAAYPKTKAEAEKKVKKAAAEGLPCIILRPHLIWGPGDNHLVPRILARSKRLARIGKGNPPIDTVYIDNAAHAHILADKALAARPELSGNIYFVSDNDPVPLWDMVDAILAAGCKPPVSRRVPLKLARGLASFLEGLYTLFKLPGEPMLTGFTVKELSTAHWFDIEDLCRDTGYAPLVSRKEGLNQLERYLKGTPL
ncbi:nucleoside-diphosphate-sugar epimerase [Desulfobotulus alkaliphilus]|uniref:Nucleoside-diphosphate-sugar epimerase n=1 Tax=Desulfobotulus alkaliphilus TaxID=622671 RepID=A0A562RVS2_9BACT|nr:NAD-dependent epimerase/dehydratase family protein [Desulfobotulus alkaliphilus]TWI73199.1 nucleoside-diphosphate-sugar epimerase [Desulfobotulus alkaliphilus]